ncbi:MAG: GAF domain-containing protein [Bdellovibrionaceae bacterium]|nr:GAF domain-containing protein [Pseudobdellovibrionaceae bacterium]
MDTPHNAGPHEKPQKIIIGDFAPVKFEMLIRMWNKQNIVSEAVTEAGVFLSQLKRNHYDLAIVNLLLGGIGPNKLIKDVKALSANKDIRVVVVSKQVHRLNIENAVRAGADDFVAEPFDRENVFHRIIYHLGPKKVVEEQALETARAANSLLDHKDFISLLLNTVESLSRESTEKSQNAILHSLQGVARLLDSNRTSLILFEDKVETGLVVASSDDPDFKDFRIKLNSYPEVQHVATTGQIVLVDDVNRNQMTKNIQDKVKSIQIGSIMVFPVRFHGNIIGVLVVRRKNSQDLPPVEVLSMLQALANILASHCNIKLLLRKIYSDFAANG